MMIGKEATTDKIVTVAARHDIPTSCVWDYRNQWLRSINVGPPLDISDDLIQRFVNDDLAAAFIRRLQTDIAEKRISVPRATKTLKVLLSQHKEMIKLKNRGADLKAAEERRRRSDEQLALERQERAAYVAAREAERARGIFRFDPTMTEPREMPHFEIPQEIVRQKDQPHDYQDKEPGPKTT